MSPKFTIIVPLYNKAPYVRKALQSVCNQTYADWECLIIDDGSTDGSADVVRDYIRALNGENGENGGMVNMHVLSQQNAGVAAARNRGVKDSKGEYVSFLDADDWWESNFLEEVDKLIAEYPDAGIYCTNYIYYKPGKTHVALNLPRGYMNYPQAYLQSVAMPVTSITTCMPRKVFDEMGGFPVGIKLGEDFMLWAKTAVHYKIAFCEKPLAYYNNDIPASLRATRNLYEPQFNMLFNLESLESEIRLNGENGEEWKALFDWLRVNGLMEYWMSDEYNEAAAKELDKVDWSKQPRKMLKKYKQPIWVLRYKRRFMQIGSYCKQNLLRMITKMK